MLKALSISLVEYNSDDAVGKMFALSSMIPLHILSSQLAILVLSYTLIIYLLVGQLLNELLNAALKHLIAQERPARASQKSECARARSGYGMPSSHTQFMSYFTSFALMYSGVPLLGTLILIGATLLVAIGRVYLGYHSILQVLVGGIVGVMFAILWKSIVKRMMKIDSGLNIYRPVDDFMKSLRKRLIGYSKDDAVIEKHD